MQMRNRDIINEIITKHLGTVGMVDKKKYNIMQAVYAPEVKYEEVLLLRDTSFFGNGKSGNLITENAFISKESSGIFSFYYKDVKTIVVEEGTGKVIFHNGEEKYLLNSMNVKFLELLSEIVETIDQIDEVQDNTTVSESERFRECLLEDEREMLSQMIHKIYLTSSTYVYKIDQLKISKAINAFSVNTNKENVMAFIDFTVFGSGKEGIIFEYDKFIYKYKNTKVSFLYRDLEKIEIIGSEDGSISRIVMVYKDNSYNFIAAGDIPFSKGAQYFALKKALEFIKELYEEHQLSEEEEKKLTLEEIIEKLLRRYQTSLSTGVVYIGSDIDIEKFNKAKNKYAINAIYEQTFLIAENSSLLKKQNGCMITFWGFYSYDSGSKTAIYYNDIEHMESDKEHLYLTLKNGTKITICNDVFYEDVLCKLLTQMVQLYQYYQNNIEDYNIEDSKYDYITLLKSQNTCYEELSMEKLEEYSESGNPYSTLEMAKRYRKSGKSQGAIELLKGIQNAQAYYMLGEMFYEGELGNKDMVQAEYYFKCSMELGDLRAEVWLANFVFFGVNCNQDYDKGFKMYQNIVEKVEERFLPESIMNNLGVCYCFGYGCERDVLKAEYWLAKIYQTNDHAKFLLAEIYIEDQMFTDKVKQGISFLEELCEKGYKKAIYSYAELLMRGHNVDWDINRAKELLLSCEDEEDAQVMYLLGVIFVQHPEESGQEIKGAELIEKASEMGHVSATRDLAILYQYGICVKRSIAKASELFEKAAQQGDSYSAQWKDRTKEIFNRIRAIDLTYSDMSLDEVVYQKIEDKAIWNSQSDMEVYGLHKLVYDYPEMVKNNISVEKFEFAKKRFVNYERAINSGITQHANSIVVNQTRYFSNFLQRQGHGSGLEYGAHVNDLLHFKNAKWVGGTNVIHGADRIVNGVHIQSKCYDNVGRFMKSVFPDGEIRYQHEGKPMIIEVNSDLYENIQKVKHRMTPEQVEFLDKNLKNTGINSVQSNNITKFGNLESIKADAKLGVYTGLISMGLGMAASYGQAVLNGNSTEEARKQSLQVGINIFGKTFITTTITSQFMKTQFVQKSMPVPGVLTGEKAQGLLSHVTGDKMTQTTASNYMKATIVTSAVTVAVLSSADVVRLIQGRISKEQLFKNVTITTAQVAGGAAGMIIGSAIGDMLIPNEGFGKIIGGAIGAALVSGAAKNVTERTLNCFIENDGDKMLEIFNRQFAIVAEEYMLVEDEICYVSDTLMKGELLSDKVFRDIYASDDREEFCRELVTPFIEEVASLRNFIVLPRGEEMAS